MSAPFLWQPGTSNNGLLTASALTLLSTELNSVASAGAAVSSVGGTSGVFSNASTGQAVFADLFLKLGAIASALSSGANLAGWFLTSPDGTTFENVVSGAALARPPDFFIPAPATTISAGSVYRSAGRVILPALKFKVFVQNNLGQTLAASANTLTLAPFALQY